MTTFKLFLYVSFRLENIKAFYLFYKDTVMSRTLIRISRLPSGQAHPCLLIKFRNDFMSGILNTLWVMTEEEAVVHLLQKKKKRILGSGSLKFNNWKSKQTESNLFIKLPSFNYSNWIPSALNVFEYWLPVSHNHLLSRWWRYSQASPQWEGSMLAEQRHRRTMKLCPVSLNWVKFHSE